MQITIFRKKRLRFNNSFTETLESALKVSDNYLRIFEFRENFLHHPGKYPNCFRWIRFRSSSTDFNRVDVKDDCFYILFKIFNILSFKN